MPETKHTPGPWLVNDDEDVWSERLDGAPDVPLVRADRSYRRWGREIGANERAANARLIAAAPDLYAAAAPLGAMVEHFSGPDEEMFSVSAGELRALLSAARKARGE